MMYEAEHKHWPALRLVSRADVATFSISAWVSRSSLLLSRAGADAAETAKRLGKPAPNEDQEHRHAGGRCCGET